MAGRHSHAWNDRSSEQGRLDTHFTYPSSNGDLKTFVGPYDGRSQPIDPRLPSLSRQYRHGPANVGSPRSSSSATTSISHSGRPELFQDGQLDPLASGLDPSPTGAGRWIDAPDGPWSSERLRAQFQGMDPSYGAPMLCHDDELLSHGPAKGNHLSSGLLASDSGYGSQVPTVASVTSGDASESDRRHISSAHPSLATWVSVRGPQNLDGEREIPCRPETEPWIPGPLEKLSASEKSSLYCSSCNKDFRCRSELKKHRLRHEKPHRCSIRGCTKIGGFTTANDLDRHLKCVHKLRLKSTNKSWRCASMTCKAGDKIWPRLDNFRSHVKRMHEGEDLEQLVKRSEFSPTADEPDQTFAMDRLDEAIETGEPMLWELDTHKSPLMPTVARSEISTAVEEADETLAIHGSYQFIETGEPMVWEPVTDYPPQLFKAAGSDDLFSTNNRSGPSLADAARHPRESVDDTDPIDGTDGYFSRIQGTDDISLRGEDMDILRAGLETAPALTNQNGEPSAGDRVYPSDGMEVGTNENVPEFGQERTMVERSSADARSEMAVPGPQSNIQELERGGSGSELSENCSDRLTALVEGTSRKIMTIVAESVGDELANLADDHVSEKSGRDDLSEQVIGMAHSKSRSQEPGPSACQTSESKHYAGCEQIKEKIMSKIIATKVQTLLREVLATQMTRSDVGREKSSPDSSSADDASSKKEDWPKCEHCHKSFPRKCALTKHMKRHTKPYQCTRSECSKKFGSKNDWKRHETTQHPTQEAWVCNQTLEHEKDLVCGIGFLREIEFRVHLGKQHAMKGQNDINAVVRSCNVGQSGQPRFWCKFCQLVLPAQADGPKGREDRFDHIARHYHEELDLAKESQADNVVASLEDDDQPNHGTSSDESMGAPDSSMQVQDKQDERDGEYLSGARQTVPPSTTAGHEKGSETQPREVEELDGSPPKTRRVLESQVEVWVDCCQCHWVSEARQVVCLGDGSGVCDHQFCKGCLQHHRDRLE